MDVHEQLGPVGDAARAALADLDGRQAGARLWAGDHTLWQDDPAEVADRLGWLHVAAEMEDQVDDLVGFAGVAAAGGFTHALVMGMGGSSLFPEVLARVFGAAPGGLALSVLDSTDPAAVVRVRHELPLEHTLFVASSKSGTTVETRSHLAYFRDLVPEPRQFVAITDPSSALDRLATAEGFRRVFRNRADIGGRYSALSHFGLVPAALLGVDLRRLLASAAEMAVACGPSVDVAANPAGRLAAALAGGVTAGHDKLTVVLPKELAAFGLWLEQLVAESTGKLGTGIVPVVGEPPGPPAVYGDDRLFVSVGRQPGVRALADAGHPVVELPWSEPADPYRLGGEVLRWEMATALAGALLGVNPFDQPDVAAAKEATGRVLEAGLPDVPTEGLAALLSGWEAGDYLAIQAYVDPASVDLARLQSARMRLRDHHRVATTLGVGPRFLHSTGQLHKGGPPTGVFAQVVGADAEEVPIPGQPFGFSALKQAQAAGDLEALRSRGLRVARVSMAELADAGS